MFYKFNPVTKEYINEVKNACYTLNGKLSKGYTKYKPPAFDNDKICKFIDGKWQVSLRPKDYRGTWVNVDGDIQNITELDVLPKDGYAKENNSSWYFADGTLAMDITTAQLTKRKWQEVRNKRNELLKESDIYMLSDNYNKLSADMQKAWVDYRQKIRDIPETYKNPNDVVFPDKPNLIKEA